MMEDIQQVLYTEEQIKNRVKGLAKELDDEYQGKNPLILCILKGSFIFTSDLVRAMETPCEVDFIQASSYGMNSSSGTLKIKKDLDADIRGRHVIVAEDILDTGITLSYIANMLKDRGAASVKICAFFTKPARRKVDIEADYVGFEVPNEFIVGYGLDYAERYRGLPYVGVLKREVYEGN